MALSPVVIEFMQKGLPEISRAIRSVEQQLAQSERVQVRSAQRLDSIRERSATYAGRFAAKQAAEEARVAQSAERRRIRSEEQNANRLRSIRERSASYAGQFAAKQASAEQRAARDRLRAEEQNARRIQGIRERSASMAGRFAAKLAADDAREAKKKTEEQKRQAKREQIETFSRREMYAGAIGRGVAGAAALVGRGVGALASTVSQLGGGFSVGDSLQEKVSLDRQAILLANKAILPGGGRANKNDILAKVRAASIATGTDEDKLLGAWGAYTDKTGDFTGGEKNLEFFGKLAKATGSDIGEISKTAGQLRVQNRTLGEKDMKQLLLDVVQQGRSGSVDMPELARSASKITKSSSSYAGSQTENQRKLLGLSQIAVRTSGGVDEAATVLSNIAMDAGKHNDKITAALGAGTFDNRGRIAKGPEEFLADVMDKTGGNMQSIQKLGFGARSLKMFQALAPIYDEGLASGGKAGARSAVLAEMKSFTGATYDEKSLEKDFAEVMKSSAEQFEGAVRLLKQEVGDKLVPELLKLVPVLRDLTPPLVRFLDAMIKVAEWASRNPFEGLALLIGAAITKEIIAAQIGQTIKSLLAGGGGGGGGGGPLPGGLPSPAGAGGGGVGFAQGGAIMAGMSAQGFLWSNLADRAYGAQAAGSAAGSQLAADATSGDPAKQAAARKAIEEARAKSGTAAVASGYVDYASTGLNILTNPLGSLANYGTNKAMAGAGMTTGAQVTDETMKAQATVSKFEEDVTKASTALRQLGTAASLAATNVGASNPNADSRNKPLNARGGTR